jgi:hypothetical protein
VTTRWLDNLPMERRRARTLQDTTPGDGGSASSEESSAAGDGGPASSEESSAAGDGGSGANEEYWAANDTNSAVDASRWLLMTVSVTRRFPSPDEGHLARFASAAAFASTRQQQRRCGRSLLRESRLRHHFAASAALSQRLLSMEK